MTRDELQQKMSEAENNCRVIYDQYVTAKENLKALKIKLERSRGAYQQLQELVKVEDEVATSGEQFPAGREHTDESDYPTKSSKKTEKELKA